jgi:diguanylate cyclase (GGDEF)-like protein
VPSSYRVRRSAWRRIGKPGVAALAVLGIAAVGVFDWATGTDVRVFPLYFLPLALAARRLGRTGAVWMSLLATATWLVALYEAGREYPHPSIWLINALTQGSAFLVVSLLVAHLELRLRHEHALSRTDALTGLLNSRAFHEKAEAMLLDAGPRQRPATLAYIDLDHFKRVNDRDGHDAGDRLLARIGGLLATVLGPYGLVARMGGDEFAALLPDLDEAAARELLERTREALIADPDVQSSGVSASVGGVTHVPAAPRLDDMIRQPDALMYSVKSDGKNAVRVQRAA